MIGHIACWFIRRQNRVRWRDALARREAYAEMALEAAIQAQAASRAGYVEDARILVSLSDQLTRLGNSPDGKSAINLMKAMAHTATIVLPTWDECRAAVDAGEATALHRFIYANENWQPPGEFRAGLLAFLQEAAGQKCSS